MGCDRCDHGEMICWRYVNISGDVKSSGSVKIADALGQQSHCFRITLQFALILHIVRFEGTTSWLVET